MKSGEAGKRLGAQGASLGMIALACVAIAAGCKTNAGTTAGAGGGATTGQTSSQSTSTGSPEDMYFSCKESGIVEPVLNGPGYNAMTGFTGTPKSSYVVSSTVLYVPADPDPKNGVFTKSFPPILTQLSSAPGVIAFALGNDAGCNSWRTLVVWDSQDSMMKFVTSGQHAVVMPQVKTMSEAGKVTNWMATPTDVMALTWEVARTHLAAVPPLY
jgi:hypothetical protein